MHFVFLSKEYLVLINLPACLSGQKCTIVNSIVCAYCFRVSVNDDNDGCLETVSFNLPCSKVG